MNELLSGLQSRYVAGTSQALSCAESLRPYPVMDTDDEDDDDSDIKYHP